MLVANGLSRADETMDARKPLIFLRQFSTSRQIEMFETAQVNPPDAIFGLIEEYKRDPNPNKVNLTVGMYQDEHGHTPVMECVRVAKKLIHDEGKSHVYLPISGSESFNQRIPALVFGDSHPVISEHRACSAQTPGGTTALRVAGEMLHKRLDVKNIWISDPTWANHKNIFPAAGLNIKPYRYLDERGTGFDCQGMLESISKSEPHDAILLHTVCHNPTGVDPTPDQWKKIFDVIESRNLVPIFDFAYQGFGQSVDADAFPIREFSQRNLGALICSSFSKNFNLYGERVGAITVLAKNRDQTQAVFSQVKAVVRANYSNPPTFGGQIVKTVFEDAELRSLWLKELEEMRVRISELRSQFVNAINQRLPEVDFSHIIRQRGMFSYSGISGDVVDELKNEHSIYLLKSGRINIAGINSNNLDRLCDAIASVMAVKN